MRIFFQASLFRVMCLPNNRPVRTVLIDYKLCSASAICLRDNMIMSYLLVSEFAGERSQLASNKLQCNAQASHQSHYAQHSSQASGQLVSACAPVAERRLLRICSMKSPLWLISKLRAKRSKIRCVSHLFFLLLRSAAHCFTCAANGRK